MERKMPGIKFGAVGKGTAIGDVGSSSHKAGPVKKKLKKLEHTVNRSLNLMENARAERDFHMEENATQYFFGAMLAERMMFEDENPIKQVYSDIVRDVIATCPRESKVLDLRPFIQKLSDEEIWRICGECRHATDLMLAGWLSIAEKPLRAISITLGDTLRAIDMSQVGIGSILNLFSSLSSCVHFSSSFTAVRLTFFP